MPRVGVGKKGDKLRRLRVGRVDRRHRPVAPVLLLQINLIAVPLHVFAIGHQRRHRVGLAKAGAGLVENHRRHAFGMGADEVDDRFHGRRVSDRDPGHGGKFAITGKLCETPERVLERGEGRVLRWRVTFPRPHDGHVVSGAHLPNGGVLRHRLLKHRGAHHHHGVDLPTGRRYPQIGLALDLAVGSVRKGNGDAPLPILALFRRGRRLHSQPAK